MGSFVIRYWQFAVRYVLCIDYHILREASKQFFWGFGRKNIRAKLSDPMKYTFFLQLTWVGCIITKGGWNCVDPRNRVPINVL